MGDSTDDTIDVNIWNDARTKSVTVTTDGANERLDVDANISGGLVNVADFKEKYDIDLSGTSLNTSTDVTIFTFTGSGKIDYIGIAGSNANYEVALTVDATELFRLNMTEVGSTLALAAGTDAPMWTEVANKNYRFHPSEAGYFSTSFNVKCKATIGAPVIEWIIRYREEV